ncbi:hypothetical protein L0156_19955 [bacterium]|nr:hypothetical protein [bacterium]
MRARKDRSVKTHREIIRKIRELHQRGEPLNIHAVKRLHPDLLRRVYSVRPFWGWAQAVRAAGLDYRHIRIQLLETVPCQLCGKEFRNLTFHLPVHEVSTDEYKLSFPDEYLHSESLRSERSDSLLSRNPLMEHWEPLWSEEYILERIHEYFRRGIPVNDGFMHARDRAFEGIATKYFGSWDNALRKAGLNPEAIRLQDPRILYDRKDVIRELRKRYRSGKPLNHAAVHSEDARLCNAARRKFGSYSAALAACGMDPSKVRLLHEPYTETDRMNLLEAIRKTAAMPEGRRRAVAICTLRMKYQKTLKRLLPSWRGAAEAAGVKYRAIDLRDHRDFSTQEKVIRALKDRLNAGKSLISYHLKDDDRRLYKAVLEHFPNYYDCYPFLGLHPSSVRGQRRYASAEEVITEIRRRCDLGLGTRVVDLVFGPKRTRDNPLLKSAVHFFGRWSTALNFANVPPEKKRPKNSPSSTTILKTLREKRRRHGPK